MLVPSPGVLRAAEPVAVAAADALRVQRAAGAKPPQVRVEMSADRNELTVNDNVAVRIYVQTQGPGQPDIEVPEFEGFQVVQRAVQRPMQFSFGFGQAAAGRDVDHAVHVRAGADGPRHVQDPAGARDVRTARLSESTARADGQRTRRSRSHPTANPPQTRAQPDQQPPQRQRNARPRRRPRGDTAVFDQEAFLRTVVDKTEPYEGEQVTATIYLYTRHNLQQVPAVQTEASTDGLWVQDLLSATRSLEPTRQIVNGHGFWVYVLRRFAGFPLRSGELTIGSMALTISRDSVFDLFDPTRGPARCAAQLGAGAVARETAACRTSTRRPDRGREVRDQNRDRSHAGRDRRCRDVDRDRARHRQSAHGQIADPNVTGLQILQPEVHDLVETPNDRVQGTRTFAWLIVPEAPGTYSLPALTLNTFDPETHSYKRITGEHVTLTAVGAARAASAQAGKLRFESHGPERSTGELAGSSRTQRTRTRASLARIARDV